MTPQRWQQIKEVFTAAQARPSAEREAFLRATCGDDSALCDDVRALLAADADAVDDVARTWVVPLRRGLFRRDDSGDRIGPYEIRGEIGRGGMGVVYRARDPRLERDVALKLLPPVVDETPGARARLLAEARAASALDHPNICTIYEAGEAADGRLYIAMACYEGRTLEDRLTEGPLGVDESADVARQMAAGLACAHRAGIVHRDVKPANVVVLPPRTAGGGAAVKILDFGIAKLERGTSLTRPGTRVGTVAYMAPEQVRGEPVDGRTDLWALGVVLYEMLTGRRPFTGVDDQAVVYAILHRDPPPVSALRPDVPDALAAVVRRALARAPAHRVPDAEAFAAALDATRATAGGRSDTAAPHPAAAPIHLPTPLTNLVGRTDEVARGCALLARVRLLTLTGPAGIGKTRLGLAIAAHAAPDFADGAFFVNLAPVSDPEQVAAAIAHTLDVPERTGQPRLADLQRVIGHGEVLLVLDNFEHVMEAAPVVTELLTACPRLKLLVTSRMALSTSGEQELPVPPLERPGVTTAEPDSLRRCAAVQLFVERARAARPDFDLTPDNADAVAELCRRLDGLPLALELAAARIKLFSAPALLARLSGRLDLLKGDRRDRPSRHRTLQHAIAWSYDLLDDRMQRAFRMLSVFTGGFTLEAAEAILGDVARTDADVVDVVAALLDHSLLHRQDDAAPRYSMLETIRAFGRQCLDRHGETAAAGRRHAQHFTALAEQAEPALTGPDQAAALDRLEAEYDNLRDALSFTEADGDGALGLRLAASLWRYWLIRGTMGEGRRWLERLLRLAGDGVPPDVRARALHGVGTIAHNQGDNEQARAFLERGLALWRGHDDRHGTASALNNLGWVACELSDLGTARRRSEEALALCRSLDDRRGMALALNNLGWVAHYQGDARAAAALHEQSLVLRREIGDGRGAAFALSNLAMAARLGGDYDGARVHLEEAHHLLEAVKDRLLSLWMHIVQGVVAHDLGEEETAAALLETDAPRWREIGNRSILAWGLTVLGDVRRAGGDLRQARAQLEEALSVWDAIGCTWGVAFAHHCLGCTALARGDREAAYVHLTESLRLREALEDRRGQAECLEALAVHDADDGAPEGAVARLHAARALRRACGAPLPPGRRDALRRTLAALQETPGSEALDYESEAVP